MKQVKESIIGLLTVFAGFLLLIMLPYQLGVVFEGIEDTTEQLQFLAVWSTGILIMCGFILLFMFVSALGYYIIKAYSKSENHDNEN